MTRIIELSILFLVLSLVPNISLAQNIAVTSFRLLETDMDANLQGTRVLDQNGETAALIKIVTTEKGFGFSCGAIGIVKTVETPGEIWLYVPRGAQKITIKHPQLGVLRDYYFKTPVQGGRTYEMVLTTGKVQTIVKQSIKSQYLVIKVIPEDAVIELDENVLPVANGIAQKLLKFGTYNYRIQAKNYHAEIGEVTINNPNEKKVLNIELKPAFGWLEIDSSPELDSAQVFVDNSFEGFVPLKSSGISSGKHNIKIVKEFYHTFEQIVEVKDNQTTKISPSLEPNYSMVTILVDNNAGIFVNNEFKANGRWVGKMASGTYNIEAKKENHRSTSMSRDILSSQNNQTIKLEAPTPIMGGLNITSNPALADVIIDGQNYGQTPLLLSDFLVGNHKLIIRHNGYADFISSFNLEEGKEHNIDAKLENIANLTISCNSPLADFYVDGVHNGKANGLKSISVGKHLIEIKPSSTERLLSYNKEIFISGTEKNLIFNLELQDIDVLFESDKQYTYVFLDNEMLGTDFYNKYRISAGDHIIAFRTKGYDEIKEKVNIDSSINKIIVSFKKKNISIERKVIQRTTDIYNISDTTNFIKQVTVGNYNYKTLKNNTGCLIKRVTRDNDGTKIYMTCSGKVGARYRISRLAYIKDPTTGERYELTDAFNMAIVPEFTTATSESFDFMLKFPVLPENVHVIDIVEPSSSWKFFGVSIE